jgi:hypothetical protein
MIDRQGSWIDALEHLSELLRELEDKADLSKTRREQGETPASPWTAKSRRSDDSQNKAVSSPRTKKEVATGRRAGGEGRA